MIERALAAGCVPVAALVDIDDVVPLAEELRCPVYGGGVDVRRVVTGLGYPTAIVALFERPARPTVAQVAESADRLVVLEAVDNPVNVGSIIRNAAAFGWDGLILDHTSADPLARRSLRVAVGTAFALPTPGRATSPTNCAPSTASRSGTDARRGRRGRSTTWNGPPGRPS